MCLEANTLLWETDQKTSKMHIHHVHTQTYIKKMRCNRATNLKTSSRHLKNTAHGPLWAGGQQFEKRVFFSPFFWRLFVVFWRKILFLSFTMTSNAFSRTIKRFLKGS